MKKIKTFFGLIGVLTILTAIYLSFNPSVASQISFLSLIKSKIVLYLLIALTLVYGLLGFRKKGFDHEKLFLDREDLEKVEEDKGGTLEFEEGLEERITEYRGTVKDILIEEKGLNSNEAEEVIESGDWTSDNVSAAFIESSLNYPLLERLRDWLEENGTLERRTERCVEAVEKLYTGDKFEE